MRWHAWLMLSLILSAMPAFAQVSCGSPADNIYDAIRVGDLSAAAAIAKASPTLLTRDAPTGDARLPRATPISFALYLGEDEIAINMIKLQQMPDLQLYLHEAVFTGRVKASSWLLDLGAPTKLDERPGFLARNLLSVLALSEAGNSRLASLLIQAGVGLNERESNGGSPLWYACLSNNHDLARFLIELGARPAGVPEVERASDLVLAVVSSPGQGDVEMLKYLREKGLFTNGSEKYWEKMERIAGRHPETGVSKYLRQVQKEHTK